MTRTTFSPAAIADISEIWDYTAATWGLDQADRYTEDIRDACDALASGARKGRIVDIREGYLKHSIGRHVIFFRQQENGIVVIRILHQSMDVARYL